MANAKFKDITELLENKRYLIVGDLHGCYDELQELLKIADFKDDDILISVGDLTDRGPKNKLTVQFCMDLHEEGRFHSVMGNHDDRLMRWLKGNPVDEGCGLKETVREIKNNKSFRQKAFAFISTFPHILKTPAGYVVHGGFKPTNTPDNQSKSDCLYMRYYGGYGYFDDLNGVMWYTLWPEHFPQVFFGHHPHDEREVMPNVTSLDCGCVFDGTLNAFDSKTNKLITVEAKTDYTDKELK